MSRRHTSAWIGRTLCVALVFVLLAPCATRADDIIPDAATIREHISAAAGTPWVQEKTDLVVRRVDAVETRTTWRKDSDFRQDDVEGPFETQFGSVHGQMWRQSENGVTVLIQPEPGHERSLPSNTTVRRITTPVNGYVLETLDRQGFGTRQFVDRTTWRMVRQETMSTSGKTTTVFDDFRTTDGTTRAWHWVQTNGRPEDTEDVHIERTAPGPVTGADVAMRGFRRDLLTFPSGVNHVDLPIHVEDGQAYVRATVGDRGLDLVLDSGASYLTLSSDVAEQLGLHIFDKQSGVTAQHYVTARAILPSLKIGPFEMHDVVVHVLPPLWTTSQGDIKGAGLLGFDFLAQAAFKLDYEHSRLTLFPSDLFVPPAAPHMVTLDLRLASGQPQTTMAINGSEADRLIVDTGGSGTLLLFDYFVSGNPDILKTALYDNATKRFLGVGGTFLARAYQFPSLQLGSVKFTDFTGYVVASRGSYDSTAEGLVGSSFLQLFDVWIDYTNSHIFLVPNDKGRRTIS